MCLEIGRCTCPLGSQVLHDLGRAGSFRICLLFMPNQRPEFGRSNNIPGKHQWSITSTDNIIGIKDEFCFSDYLLSSVSL